MHARGVLIDTEERVINNKFFNGPLRELFAREQTFTSTDGAGNNWAAGFFDYWNKCSEEITDIIRL